MKRIFVKKNGDYGKKIKLSTTDVVISVLVISILILGVKEIYDKIQYEKTATVVGEIIYNESFENGGADIKVGSKFYIQLLPLGQENGALFTYAFTKNSASESESREWLSEMPELHIGAIVEIEYRLSRVIGVSGKEIISIKRVEPTDDMNFNIPLVPNENYFLNIKTRGRLELGYVYRVVRIEEMGGYLFYIGDTSYPPLDGCWIDDEVLEGETEDIKEAFRTGEFSELVRIQIANGYYHFDQEMPFVGYDCYVINDIEFFPYK